MGSEYNFDEKEKEKAHAGSVNISIGSIRSLQGNIGQGNVSGNNTLNTGNVQQPLNQLKPHASDLESTGAAKLSESIAALEAALAHAPHSESKIRGLMTDLRNALTGAAGNLIATGAMTTLNAILGTGVPTP